jgi:mycothiol synthase
MSFDDSPLRIGPVATSELRQALQLVFCRLPESERERQVETLLRTWEETETGVGKGPAPTDSRNAMPGVVAACRSDTLVGAVFAHVQPGATAVLYPPQLGPAEPLSTAGQLLDRVLQWISTTEVRMAQALLETDAEPVAEVLRQGGFQRLTDLLYLVSPDSEFPASRPPSSVEFEPYCEANRPRLRRIIDATYEQTLDCPQLNGVRQSDDVMAGYQATGEFDPSRWLIVRHGGADVGCLLLADHAEHNTWELVYMGLVAGARGRGWGTDIARFAQWLARQAGRPRLVAAVDAANEPAIRVYAAAGFQAWDRRAVFVKQFGPASSRFRSFGLS